MTQPLRVLVTYGLLVDRIERGGGRAEFAERFPDVSLATVPYEVPLAELTSRASDPGAPRSETLTDEQAEAFAAADVLVSLVLPLRLAEVAPRVRWVQAIGSGIGQFMASGVEHVTCTNAAGVSAPGIAEWVLAQVLSIHKRLPEHQDQQRRHEWRAAMGSELGGKRAAVVGLGAIGQEVAWRLGAMGLHVTGVRRRPPEGALPAGVAELATPDRLLEVVAASDVVVAAVPGNPASVDMFGADVFAAMPAGSVFVNVGRGTSVDEAALIAALSSGHLRGAAIDVTRQEPLPADDPLWDAPNLSISPHSSASNDHYASRLWTLFLDNLARFRAGEPLRNVVDMAAEYGR